MASRHTKPRDGSNDPPPSEDEAVEVLETGFGKPADELFKAMLRSRAEAVSVLESALSKEVAARIDWNTLEAVPTEQVDRWLDKRYSDLLFRVGLKGEGQAAFVNVMLEHQSRAERFMPLRVLGMTVRLWEGVRRDDPKAKRLPLILPVVLYPGKRGRAWRHFVLDDLSQQSVDALFERQLTELALVTLRLLRDATSPGFLENLQDPRELAAWRQVGEGPEGLLAYQQFWIYLYGAIDVPNEQIHDFREEVGPSRRGNRDDRRTETDRPSGAKLKAEAEAKCAAGILKRQLGLKFGDVDATVLARIDSATMAELECWTERILTARSIEGVLG